MGNSCFKPTTDSETNKLDTPDEVVIVDWNDERSVLHRSAMNSLHNYALGKMNCPETEALLTKTISKLKFGMTNQQGTTLTENKSSSQSISFAIELHQTFHFERQSMSMDSDSTGLQNASCSFLAVNDELSSSQPQSPTSSEYIPFDRSTKVNLVASADCGTHYFGSTLPRFPCGEDDTMLDTARLLRIE